MYNEVMKLLGRNSVGAVHKKIMVIGGMIFTSGSDRNRLAIDRLIFTNLTNRCNHRLFQAVTIQWQNAAFFDRRKSNCEP